MLNMTGSLKVYLAVEPVDLRKGFVGLYGLTVNVLKERPESGALFVFTNRHRTRIKTLYWDGTGLWVMTKRLEKGTFNWPSATNADSGKLQLRAETLTLLLNGIDLRDGVRRAWYKR